jgi:hypothetical protein
VFRANFANDRDSALADYRAYTLKHENDPLGDPHVQQLSGIESNARAPAGGWLLLRIVESRIDTVGIWGKDFFDEPAASIEAPAARSQVRGTVAA